MVSGARRSISRSSGSQRHFRDVITGSVERYELPNLKALNFLLHGALDGGGTLSLKTDAQGKVFSTAMLRMVLDVPDADAKALGLPGAPSKCRGARSLQLALLTIGVIVWGYGSRIDDTRLTWIGLGFFAAALVLRFFKRSLSS